ncbi:MAG: hypothetical protein O8C67_15715 [Candidatus Methanoperedens sp.]|nr:hypothetical protein [Candidatus Methanoperedens sp.]
MRRLVLVLLLAFLLASLTVDARAPKIGDEVRIMIPYWNYQIQIEGKIADLAGDFVCLNSHSVKSTKGEIISNSPMDMCLGVGQIQMLTWTQ